MRPTFFVELHKQMGLNENIFALTGDLGYGGFDKIMEDFPDRFINVGAAEQSMLDIAVGLAYDGKIPFCYSIPPFLIYRPFETIRTYINHENLNVKLVGSGRDKDYAHDGYSHNAEDIPEILLTMKNIKQMYPQSADTIPNLVEEMVNNNGPYFISLKR